MDNCKGLNQEHFVNESFIDESFNFLDGINKNGVSVSNPKAISEEYFDSPIPSKMKKNKSSSFTFENQIGIVQKIEESMGNSQNLVEKDLKHFKVEENKNSVHKEDIISIQDSQDNQKHNGWAVPQDNTKMINSKIKIENNENYIEKVEGEGSPQREKDEEWSKTKFLNNMDQIKALILGKEHDPDTRI